MNSHIILKELGDKVDRFDEKMRYAEAMGNTNDAADYYSKLCDCLNEMMYISEGIEYISNKTKRNLSLAKN